MKISQVDLAASQPLRREVHRQVRLREHLIRLMTYSRPDEDGLLVAVESEALVSTVEAVS